MCIAIEGPELSLVNFENIPDIFKGKKLLYFTIDVI